MPRCGVVGDPVGHSLSPVLHRAAYAALGLVGWRYDRHRVPAGRLADHVDGLDLEWVGLSVTMPGKEEALALATEAGESATLLGAANTLTRAGDGWRADNTDAAGLERALSETVPAGIARAVLLGSGATARAALLALHRLGVRAVVAAVRERVRPETAALADRLGLGLTAVPTARLGAELAAAELLVSTVPPGVVAPGPVPDDLSGLTVLDVVYAPWPTPLAEQLAAAGARVGGGEAMLLHQAAEQVRLMTGQEAPLAAMRSALDHALAAGTAR